MRALKIFMLRDWPLHRTIWSAQWHHWISALYLPNSSIVAGIWRTTHGIIEIIRYRNALYGSSNNWDSLSIGRENFNFIVRHTRAAAPQILTLNAATERNTVLKFCSRIREIVICYHENRFRNTIFWAIDYSILVTLHKF